MGTMKRVSLTSPLAIGIAGIVIIGAVFLAVHITHARAQARVAQANAVAAAQAAIAAAAPQVPPPPVITHIATPPVVKALYMTSWIASSPKLRQHVVDMVNTTEANAIVLDIKDETGHPSFSIEDPIVANTKSPEKRIRDVVPFIQELHSKNVYVIGRIVVFKDGYLTKTEPTWTLAKKSDGTPWKDPKGSAYLDPANKLVWDYTVALAKDAYAVGFDEINFDYIRYPSDGKLSDLNYHLAQDQTRADVLDSFFKYLSTNVKKDANIPISADVFGQTTTENTDMGIGQILEHDLQYFDFVAPMIYPSHYAPGTYGLKDPGAQPYALIMAALKGAKTKIDKFQADPNISAETKASVTYSKIRPWLQDFSIGRDHYTAEMVSAQMKATYDSGIQSWLMWDPSNKYTSAAYPADSSSH
ncbi:MAG: hypothetical protein JWM20_739 [Patescibacteria group bacterium]|nr:hypothetical protein [Patescibacteria group bacterium]